MGLPALAPVTDLAAWMGISITGETDTERARALLAAASTLVRTRAGENWVDAEGRLESGIPDGIPQVVVAVAARLWANPTGASSSGAGPFTTAWPVGFALTDAEADMVDAAMGTSTFRGIGTISTTRGPIDTRSVLPDFGYGDDDLPCEPIW